MTPNGVSTGKRGPPHPPPKDRERGLVGWQVLYILTCPTVTFMNRNRIRPDNTPDMPKVQNKTTSKAKPSKPSVGSKNAVPKAKTTTKKAAKPALRAPHVLAYLQANPEFLSKHAAQLAQNAKAPKKVGNVFALHAARAGVAESKAGSLLKRLTQFTAIARANAEATQQAHEAVLALLAGAANAASFRKALQSSFKAALGIDAARLLLVGTSSTATTLTAAEIEALCLDGVWLGAIGPAQAPLFGPQATTLRSAALLRLGPPEAPLGLLALASENPSHYHAGQATPLLEFLQRAASLIIAPWAKS